MKTIVLIISILVSYKGDAQSNLDRIVHGDYLMEEQLLLLSENGCYVRKGYEMPFSPDPRPLRCDSLRKLFVNELYAMFTPKQLFELAQVSENYHIRLFGFQAFSQSSFDSDSLVEFFESEFSKGAHLYFFPNADSDLIDNMFSMVSPMYGEYYSKSNQLDLEDYVYLLSMYKNFGAHIWMSNPSQYTFNITNDHIDFEKINLNYYKKKRDTFELRSKIFVQNISNDVIIIAPYYGSNIKFDKLSYRIPANSTREIPFSSTVILSELTGPITRTIKLENYITKKYKFLTFTADFISGPD